MKKTDDRYVVRLTSEEDIEGICMLEQLSFSCPMSEDNLRAFLLGETGASVVCVDLHDQRTCAYAGALFVFDEAQLLNVAVHPDYRGLGLGRLVTESLLELARSRPMRRVTLEVRETNKIARRLYESLGFYEVGRLKNYYKKPTEDGLILQLDI